MSKKKCNYCEATEGLEYHHIIPRSLGGTDDNFNLLLVCNEHHAILHGMHKRANISELTKIGLKAAKARGKKLGGITKNHAVALEKSAKTNKENADMFMKSIINLILPLKESGKTLRYIADYLNNNEIQTARGGLWYPTTVQNIFKRLQAFYPHTEPDAQNTP